MKSLFGFNIPKSYLKLFPSDEYDSEKLHNFINNIKFHLFTNTQKKYGHNEYYIGISIPKKYNSHIIDKFINKNITTFNNKNNSLLKYIICYNHLNIYVDKQYNYLSRNKMTADYIFNAPSISSNISIHKSVDEYFKEIGIQTDNIIINYINNNKYYRKDYINYKEYFTNIFSSDRDTYNKFIRPITYICIRGIFNCDSAHRESAQ